MFSGLGPSPLASGPIRRQGAVHEVVIHRRVGLARGRGQQRGACRVGLERLAALDADAGQHRQHGGVLRLRRLDGDRVGEEMEIAHIECRQRLPRFRVAIDITRRGLRSVGQRVGLQQLAVGDGVGECALADGDRAQGDVDEHGLRRHDEIAIRGLGVVARRQEQILAAFAGIVAGAANVGERHFPRVDGAAEEHGLVRGGRHLQHHRSLPEIEDGAHVRRLVVGREELVPRLQHLREVDDVTEVRIEIALQRGPDRGHAHGRHPPDGELDGAAMDGAIVERCGVEEFG